jgi:hypothetical protein
MTDCETCTSPATRERSFVRTVGVDEPEGGAYASCDNPECDQESHDYITAVGHYIETYLLSPEIRYAGGEPIIVEERR